MNTQDGLTGEATETETNFKLGSTLSTEDNTIPSQVKPTSKDDALEAVQSKLNESKDARREERFYWFCLIIFLFDIFHFKDMETWSGPLVIGFLQFIVIVSLGRRLGVDNIWTLTEKIINKWNGKFGSSSE